jgi:hypothetical protein
MWGLNLHTKPKIDKDLVRQTILRLIARFYQRNKVSGVSASMWTIGRLSSSVVELPSKDLPWGS